MSSRTSCHFEFVFTPTHGSWLNVVEGLFCKMTRQMLTGIRVSSKNELKEHIYRYFEEINSVPVPYKWKYKMDTINLEKEDVSKIIYEVVNAKAASPSNKGKRAPVPKKRKSKKQEQVTTAESVKGRTKKMVLFRGPEVTVENPTEDFLKEILSKDAEFWKEGSGDSTGFINFVI